MHRKQQPSRRHIWCPGCGEKVRVLWNQRHFDRSEGKEIMRCEICIMGELGDEVSRLRAISASLISDLKEIE